MSKRFLFYVLFFAALAVGFYFVMTLLIPGYGRVKFPVLNNVQAFSFNNQEGKTITEKDVEGKVYVAEFFFTTCESIAPNEYQHENGLRILIKTSQIFSILSHT